MKRRKKSPPRLDRFIARPGVPTHYSATEAAKLLGFSGRDPIWRMIKAGMIQAGKQPLEMRVRSGRRWCIPRSEIIRLARVLYKDKSLNLRRIISHTQPKGALLVLSNDRPLRSALCKFAPQYVSSLFGLGQVMAVDAAWAVVLDFSAITRSEAEDVAERIASVSDRPYLIGVTCDDDVRTEGLWDLVIPRPLNRRSLQAAIAKLQKPIVD